MAQQTVFTIVGSVVLLLWILALVAYIIRVEFRVSLGALALAVGWVLLIVYFVWYWHLLGNPPMASLKDTVFIVVLCLPAIGLLSEWRWNTRLLAIITSIAATLLLAYLLLMPESMNKELMPALRSPWFAPHVVVYMLGYATLLITAVVGAWALIRWRSQSEAQITESIDLVRRLIYFAFPLITSGMIMGAFWAKVCYGTYWGWDPKETLALVTWFVYLGYIHLERYAQMKKLGQLIYAVSSFFAVLLCWIILNYLPAAKESLHTYSMGG